jgi:hypothetical protein
LCPPLEKGLAHSRMPSFFFAGYGAYELWLRVGVLELHKRHMFEP